MYRRFLLQVGSYVQTLSATGRKLCADVFCYKQEAMCRRFQLLVESYVQTFSDTGRKLCTDVFSYRLKAMNRRIQLQNMQQIYRYIKSY